MRITRWLASAPLWLLISCASVTPPSDPALTARLESWVVLGQGRHLRLVIEHPDPTGPEIVEFTSAMLRADYVWPEDPSKRNRLARMSPGDVLQPLLSDPRLRVEARYEITREQYQELARDRLYESVYFLLGPNSNSAMLDCLRDAGLDVPDHILSGGGALGEFPGVEIDAGSEIPPRRWSQYGISERTSNY